jgi:hypothetical protein
VFPVRYELDSYRLFRRNSVFKGLNRLDTTDIEFETTDRNNIKNASRETSRMYVYDKLTYP